MLFLYSIIYLVIYNFGLIDIRTANWRSKGISAKKNFFENGLIAASFLMTTTKKNFFKSSLIASDVITADLRIITTKKNFFKNALIVTNFLIITAKKNFFKNNLIATDFRYLLFCVILFFDWLINKISWLNKSTFAAFLYFLIKFIIFFSLKRFRYALCFKSYFFY